MGTNHTADHVDTAVVTDADHSAVLRKNNLPGLAIDRRGTQPELAFDESILPGLAIAD